MRGVAFLLLGAVACGAPSQPGAVPNARAIVGEVGRTRVVVLPRSTRGRIWLSLWIDAGARDADPPQLATIAMWAASVDGVAVRVLPDGIELARPCRSAELRGCLDSLAAVVGTRSVTDERVAQARRRLVDTRRRAAADEARMADALAMEALLGRGADPLGRASEDERAGTDRAQAFLASHVGQGRLLLVAVGDVDLRELRRETGAAFDRVPRARDERGRRPAEGSRAVRVEVGEATRVSAATLRPSVGDAIELARRLVARVGGDAPDTRVSADAFPVRGGGALIARIEGTRGRAALLDHLMELAGDDWRAPGASPDASDPAPPEDGPRALAQWIGALWCARQEEPVAGGIGVGAVVAGGRADRVRDADPDAPTRATALRELESMLERATRPLTLDGDVGADAVDARYAGAAIRARRVPGSDRVSAVVLFDGGAPEDPPDAHGITALLAHIAGEGCDEIARRELGATLGSLGVDAAPLLSSESWGLRIEGPSERWHEIAFLLPRCAAVARLDAAALERAREAQLRTLRGPRASVRSLVGSLLAPSAPGRVAPAGSVAGVASVGLRELGRARALRVGRARAHIALAGDAPMDEAARVVARGAARWPPGAAVELGPWPVSQQRLRAAHHPGGGHEAVIAWSARAAPGSHVVAAAFAESVARALSAEPGLRARWHEGNARGGRAWAFVVLDASPDALDALPAHVTRALSALATSWERVASSAASAAEEEQAWSESSPRALATMLATRASEPPDLPRSRSLLDELAGSPPYFLIRRPQPGRR